jgi:hypothetical protein
LSPSVDILRGAIIEKTRALDEIARDLAYTESQKFVPELSETMRAHSQLQVEIGRLEALGEFAPEGVSELADEYCALAKAGVINAVSVGFISLAREPLREGGWRFASWELLELSLVSVPANPNALVIERSLGQRDPTLAELIGRAVVAAQLRAALPPPRYTLEQMRAIVRELRRGGH